MTKMQHFLSLPLCHTFDGTPLLVSNHSWFFREIRNVRFSRKCFYMYVCILFDRVVHVAYQLNTILYSFYLTAVCVGTRKHLSAFLISGINYNMWHFKTIATNLILWNREFLSIIAMVEKKRNKPHFRIEVLYQNRTKFKGFPCLSVT